MAEIKFHFSYITNLNLMCKEVSKFSLSLNESVRRSN